MRDLVGKTRNSCLFLEIAVEAVEIVRKEDERGIEKPAWRESLQNGIRSTRRKNEVLKVISEVWFFLDFSTTGNTTKEWGWMKIMICVWGYV